MESQYSILIEVIRSLTRQIQNYQLWRNAEAELMQLRSTICDLIMTDRVASAITTLPSDVRKADIYLAFLRLLSLLVGFYSASQKMKQDAVVSVFQQSISRWPTNAKFCIHALTLALFDMPMSMRKHLQSILMKISQTTSQSLAIPNLEFLASLAHIPELYINFTETDYQRVFGVSIQYIRSSSSNNTSTGDSASSSYITELAFHVMSLWFMSLKLVDRRKYVPFIIHNLIATAGATSSQTIKDQTSSTGTATKGSQTLRHARSMSTGSTRDLTIGDQAASSSKHEQQSDEVGSEDTTGLSAQLRRAKSIPSARTQTSTTATATATTPISATQPGTAVFSREDIPAIEPGFIPMQFLPYPPVSGQVYTLRPLPDSDSINRAVSVLDRMPVIELHKIGIVYVGNGQTTEQEILRNTRGSRLYTQFLYSLGRLFSLSSCRDVYTGGLDTSSDALDGEFALCSIDAQHLSQIIFHVTTMMPSHEHDKTCTAKKRHIGNDFVMIAWNEGGTFTLETIPGQFNFFAIIIEPIGTILPSGELDSHPVAAAIGKHDTSQDYLECVFRVSMLIRQDLPKITQAADSPKIVAGASLAPYVRQLAIQANMFAQIFAQKDNPAGYVSNARERLRQIKRVRERLDLVEPAKSETGPADGGAATQMSLSSSLLIPLQDSLDFTKCMY
eukprot:jgi/Hompol1/6989/HPOL_005148-RA